MRSGLATCVVLLAISSGPAAGQEIRPTLDKIKETGVIQLGHRETSRPFSFRGSAGRPVGFSIDLCLLVKGTIDLECGSTTITFGRMVAFSHMISVDGGSLLVTTWKPGDFELVQ